MLINALNKTSLISVAKVLCDTKGIVLEQAHEWELLLLYDVKQSAIYVPPAKWS